MDILHLNGKNRAFTLFAVGGSTESIPVSVDLSIENSTPIPKKDNQSRSPAQQSMRITSISLLLKAPIPSISSLFSTAHTYPTCSPLHIFSITQDTRKPSTHYPDLIDHHLTRKKKPSPPTTITNLIYCTMIYLQGTLNSSHTVISSTSALPILC